MQPSVHDDVEDCVDDILDELGTDIVVGTQLGIGKPNHILNELVDRAVANPDIDLEIWSALALQNPAGTSDLESRLVDPLADRLFGSYPNLRYDELLQSGDLPDNVAVHKFFIQPGKYTNNPEAQQHHHSVNYTHVFRTFQAAEPNLMLTLLGVGELDGETRYNLGSNTDLSRDFLTWLEDERERGRDVMAVGQVTRNMPFMYGTAPVEPAGFDAVLDDESYDYPLFAPPHEPVSLVDHAIGLRVSSLVRDGGTLQIGIGSLGDAIGHALTLRHTDNGTYREAVGALGIENDASGLVEDLGGLAPFETGLYAATEMFVEAFIHLAEAGVLDREVYDHPAIQRLVDESGGEEARGGDGPDESDADGYGHDIDLSTLDALVEAGAISARPDAADLAFLREWGIVEDHVEFRDADSGTAAQPDADVDEPTGPTATTRASLAVDGETVPADLTDERTRSRLATAGLGDSLAGGRLLHAGFFIGSKQFYEGLREMDDWERRRFDMRSVNYTNALYGDAELKRLQRPDARFVNAGLKATALGAVASDGLADGRVISGVGGQFNFVNQAHELDGGRSIIMIPATHESGGTVESNVVWNYGHVTIPRHLRDIVVTEYGVADLRGKSDAAVVAEMIQVADSRFQGDLAAQAKAAGKLPQDWEVPAQYRNNTPEALEATLGDFRADGTLPEFPYGCELTEEEVRLGQSLRTLESLVSGRQVRELADTAALAAALRVPDAAAPYLERMDLARPSSTRERVLQRVVVYALAKEGVLER